MNIMDLPDCMLEKIFEYLPYDEIARKRTVCRRLNNLCQTLLNRGFSLMVKQQEKNLKKIKSLLPRRESERRNHPLAKHADILTCIETRISMLAMTYNKYIDLNLCCFIPGKVIDEVLNILRLVDSTTRPLRAHEVLQELRDISSMAIDHFDENIAQKFKKSLCDRNPFGSTILQIMQSPIDSSIVGCTVQSTGSRKSIDVTATAPISNELPSHQSLDQYMCQDARQNRLAIWRMDHKYRNVMRKLNRVITVQNKHMRQIRNYAAQISDLNSQIVDLRKRLEESDSKNREITANINQIAVPSTSATIIDRPRNIKPRSASIILKRRIATGTGQFIGVRGERDVNEIVDLDDIDCEKSHLARKRSKYL